MNKSDFISGAVALDLGKSGVKVAETLEIKVGDEWWNLINSKEQANLYTFTGRREKQNPYEPGTFDMQSIRVSTEIGMQGYSRIGDRSACVLPKMAVTTEGQHIIFQVIETTADQYPTLRFINLTTGTSKIIKGTIMTSPVNQVYGAWWDATNQAMGWVVSDVNTESTAKRYLVCADKEGNIVYSGSMGSLAPTLIYDIQVFPEDLSGTIYSLFWNPVSSAPWIRKTVPQVSTYKANAISVTNASQTGATVLSAITGADPSHRLSMFYSRVYGSVGVAWFNSGVGMVQFVLEKDGWANVYSLPEISTSEHVFNGISNIVVPNDGEFFITDWLTYKVGNIPSPAGYSFPENVLIFGATPIAGRKAIIWGSSSTTLYRWTLDYDTKSIEYNGIVTTTGFTVSMDWLFGHRSPTVLHETETKLLLAFRSEDPYIMLYDKTTNAIIWLWLGWCSSAAFPVTYFADNESRYGMIFMLGNSIMFFNIMGDATQWIGRHFSFEVSTVSIESIMGCTTAAELSSLIRQDITFFRFLHLDLQKLGPLELSDTRYPVLSAQNIEAIKMVAEDDNYYYLHLTRGSRGVYNSAAESKNPLTVDVLSNSGTYSVLGITSSIDCTIYISKLTMLPVAYYAGSSAISTRSGISALGINPTQKHKYINVVTEAEGGDMNVKRFNGNGITFKDHQTSNSIKDTNSGGISSLYYNIPQGAVTAYPLNKKREALFYAIRGNNIVQYGASTNIAGNDGCYTSTLPSLPFSPNCLMIDEWEDFAIALGQITDGYLPYCIFNPRIGFHNRAVAIKVADASTAECILPTADSGGIAAMQMYGSLGYAITATGKIDYINTFVSVDYGAGTEPPAEFSSIIFDYAEKTYIPYPFAREGIKVELSNISKMTKITLPETQTDLIRTMLADGTDFRGSRCILRRVFPDHSDEEGSDIILLDGYIQDWSYSPDKKGILFTVSKTLIDVGATFPKRLMNMGCSHVFKGERCGYLGADGICTKTKTDCTSKGMVAKFGGFPWVAARQRRVMWR